MTFQVGATCDEGTILVSDRLMTRTGGIRHGHLSPKIEFYANEGLAHCSAGGDFCTIYTAVVKEQMRMEDFSSKSYMEMKNVLRKCFDMAKEKEDRFRAENQEPIGRMPRKSLGGSTLFVFQKNEIPLWRVDTSSLYAIPEPIMKGQMIAHGDAENAAVFFTRTYGNRVSQNIKALTQVAVHATLMAKGEFVEGLDIGIFTKDMFRTLTDEEMRPYIYNSERIDTFLAHVLEGVE